jgi:hypothetical protein
MNHNDLENEMDKNISKTAKISKSVRKKEKGKIKSDKISKTLLNPFFLLLYSEGRRE